MPLSHAVTAAALEHAQNQIDKYKNGDLNRITIPGHEMPAKCAFLLAAFACNATKPVSERVQPFSPNWVKAETLKIGKLLENDVIKSMPASPLKRFACFTSNITMLTSHFLPSDIGTIDNIKELEPGVNTTEDFMVAHGGETAETGKMLERVMLELGHQDHPVLCYNCFNFAEVTVEEYSKLTGSKKYAAPPHAIEIFFDNELDKQVKDIVNNELLGDLIIFGASARDVVMRVLNTMEDVVVLEYSAQMAELAFEGMDAAAFRWSNNDTSHPYGKIIVKGKVKNFICVQAPGSNNGFNFASSGEAGIAENVRTLIRAMDWLKYMHLEDITKDLRRAPLFTACCEFMFQSMEITEKAIKDVAPGTYKTRHDQQSEKGGKRTKDAHANVAAAAKPGGLPASAADREIVRKGKAGGDVIKDAYANVAAAAKPGGLPASAADREIVRKGKAGGDVTKDAYANVAAAAKPGGLPASAADLELVRKGKAGSSKGGDVNKDAHAAVAAAAKPGGAPASAADREIVRKGKAGGSKGGLALTKNDQVSVAVYSTSDAIVRAMFQGSVNSSNSVGIRVVGNARNQDSLRELIRWIEEANEHESDISTNFPETYWAITAADGAPSLLNVDWTRVPPIELKGRKGMDELSFVVMGPA